MHFCRGFLGGTAFYFLILWFMTQVLFSFTLHCECMLHAPCSLLPLSHSGTLYTHIQEEKEERELKGEGEKKNFKATLYSSILGNCLRFFQ